MRCAFAPMWCTKQLRGSEVNGTRLPRAVAPLSVRLRAPESVWNECGNACEQVQITTNRQHRDGESTSQESEANVRLLLTTQCSHRFRILLILHFPRSNTSHICSHGVHLNSPHALQDPGRPADRTLVHRVEWSCRSQDREGGHRRERHKLRQCASDAQVQDEALPRGARTRTNSLSGTREPIAACY